MAQSQKPGGLPDGDDCRVLRELNHCKVKVEAYLCHETQKCLNYFQTRQALDAAGTASQPLPLSQQEIAILCRTVRNLRQLVCSIADEDKATLHTQLGVAQKILRTMRTYPIPDARKVSVEKSIFKLFHSLASAFAKQDQHDGTLACLRTCESLTKALKIYDLSGFWPFLASTYEKLGDLSSARRIYQQHIFNKLRKENYDAHSLLHILSANDPSERKPVSSSAGGKQPAPDPKLTAPFSEEPTSAGGTDSDFHLAPYAPGAHLANPPPILEATKQQEAMETLLNITLPIDSQADVRAACRIVACRRALETRSRLSNSSYTNFDPVKYQLGVLQTYLLATRPLVIPKVRQDVTGPEYWTLADWRGNTVETVMSPQSQAALVSCHQRILRSLSDSTGLSIFNHDKKPCPSLYQNGREESDGLTDDEPQIDPVDQSFTSRVDLASRPHGSSAMKRPPALSSQLIGMPLVSLTNE